jgi:Tol biopolymer transport system component
MEWFQDGTKLLVSGPVGPQEKQGIWVISVVGVSLHKLRDDAHFADISPDGSQIAFVDSNSKDLWVMNADGSQARSFYKPEEGYDLYRPMWFPNGQRLLYFKFHQENGKARVIMESRDLKGSDPIVLFSSPDLQNASWAQPGRMILGILEPPPNQKDSNLWEIRYSAETGKPKGTARRLTQWAGFRFYDLKATADGKTVAFMNLHSESDVYIGELADSGATLKTPQRLTLDELWDWPTGWTPDSKAVFFYSDFGGGTFDVYRQGLDQHTPDKITSGTDDKWAPELSPDGKWILYVSWPKATNPSDLPPGKLMRISPSGGPAEFVTDIKGHPYVGTNQGGIPSFRCPAHPGADCVLAERGEGKQIVFTALDPNAGRKGEITKFTGDPDYASWDLSPDGSRIAITIYDYKTADVQVMPVKGGNPEKFSGLPWTQLMAAAWAADGKSLYISSDSSRGTSVIHLVPGVEPKLLWKTVWDVYQITPSPDGHYLALGPQIYDANSWIIQNFPAK